MSLPVVLAIAGSIALLVGLFGGGVKAKEIEVPKITLVPRILSAVVGILLVGGAVWMYVAELSQASAAPRSLLQLEPSPNANQPAQAFVGIWRNVNPQTKSLARIEIMSQNGQTLQAHFWGACPPMPCDAGIGDAPAGSGPMTIVVDLPDARWTFVLALNGDTLHVTTSSHSTGKPDFMAEDNFRR